MTARMPVLRQNSATAETFPGNMLHDASVCCSFQTRSQFWGGTLPRKGFPDRDDF